MIENDNPQHGATLEPWTPPTPPKTHRSAFVRALIALRPAVLPIVVGAISWTVSVHGGAHSIGDRIAPLAIAAIGTTIGTMQTVSAAKAAPKRATGLGESEPHTGLIAVRAGLVAWAVAGLSALAAGDIFTISPWLRVLYTTLAAAAPLVYRKLTTEHHNELHLALGQRLALEQTVTGAQIRVEQMRQDGKTTRAVTAAEHATIQARVREDGKTTRAEITEGHKTARAVLGVYADLATRRLAPGTVSGASPELPEHLQQLLALSGSAAEALGTESLALLGHAAAAHAEPAKRPESPGQYL